MQSGPPQRTHGDGTIWPVDRTYSYESIWNDTDEIVILELKLLGNRLGKLVLPPGEGKRQEFVLPGWKDLKHEVCVQFRALPGSKGGDFRTPPPSVHQKSGGPGDYTFGLPAFKPRQEEKGKYKVRTTICKEQDTPPEGDDRELMVSALIGPEILCPFNSTRSDLQGEAEEARVKAESLRDRQNRAFYRNPHPEQYHIGMIEYPHPIIPQEEIDYSYKVPTVAPPWKPMFKKGVLREMMKEELNYTVDVEQTLEAAEAVGKMDKSINDGSGFNPRYPGARVTRHSTPDKDISDLRILFPRIFNTTTDQPPIEPAEPAQLSSLEMHGHHLESIIVSVFAFACFTLVLLSLKKFRSFPKPTQDLCEPFIDA